MGKGYHYELQQKDSPIRSLPRYIQAKTKGKTADLPYDKPMKELLKNIPSYRRNNSFFSPDDFPFAALSDRKTAIRYIAIQIRVAKNIISGKDQLDKP